MMHEFSIAGVLMAPLVIYALAALLLTVVLRWVLWRLGALRWVWHPALFEFALYVCILAALVLYV